MNPLIRGPVTVIEVAPTRKLCDFGGEWLGSPYVAFGARPFSRNYPQARLVIADKWAACPECAPLVRKHDWSAILNRLLTTYRAFDPGLDAAGYAMVRSDLAGLFLQLEARLTGEEVEVGEAA